MTAITGIFKLHRPSKRKQKALDFAFEQSTTAIRDILQTIQPVEDLYRDWGRVTKKDKAGEVQLTDKYTADTIAALLPGSGAIQKPLSSAVKEGVMRTVSRMIASYVSGDSDTGYPTVVDPKPTGFDDALTRFSQVGPDLDDENDSRAMLLKRAKTAYYPMLFCRSRDVRILMDRQQDRFFVFLNGLLSAGSDLSCPADIAQNNLVDINTGEIFNRRSKISLLCPIELGQDKDEWGWQYERFILPTLQGKANIKEGKLIKQGDEYYLHISFVFDDIETYQPQAYLGIDRGIVFTMAYGIVGLNGEILLTHSEPDGYRQLQIEMGLKRQKRQKLGQRVTARHFMTRQLESVLHRLVNRILDKAIEYQAAIVLEDLNIRVKGKWVKSAFAKIDRILAYKAALRGVPIYGHVFAAKSSMICIHCGELVDRPKHNYQQVSCPSCGQIEHSDEAAGVNIARRALYRKAEWKGGYREFHRSFSANLVRNATVN